MDKIDSRSLKLINEGLKSDMPVSSKSLYNPHMPSLINNVGDLKAFVELHYDVLGAAA